MDGIQLISFVGVGVFYLAMVDNIDLITGSVLVG